MTMTSALSFWQPYAWLIVHGYADVDSRSWAPPSSKIGERIAVHASKRKITHREYDEFLVMMKDLKIKNYPESPNDFDYGKIVGTVKIEAVNKSSKSYFAHPGYFHWILQKPEKLKPFPVKGKMGWFKVDLGEEVTK